MQKIIAIRQVPHEGLGAWENIFRNNKFEIEYIDATCAGDIPTSLENPGCQGLIILGGPMSVHDKKEFSWIEPEITLLEQCIAADFPTIGVCLGSQLLALAAGADVQKNIKKEIGWWPVQTTIPAKTDPLFKTFPHESNLFHWHGETWNLPGGAELLLGSDKCPNQAFRLKKNLYGVQCHLEITAPMVDEWAKNNAAELAVTPIAQTPEQMHTGSEKFATEAQKLAENVALGFIGLMSDYHAHS